MRKSPERCIYCDTKAKITREHIFGDWLKPFLKTKAPNTSHFTTFTDVDPITNLPIPSAAKGRLNRTGPPHVQAIKIVCAVCNETWMSGIQTAAKPYLLELIEGRWPILDHKALTILATWAQMVTTSIEFADPKTNTSNAEERQQLRTSIKPGDNWLVYIGLCQQYMDPGSFWHRGAGFQNELQDGAPAVPVKPNAQTTTFYLGRCFFHTLRAPFGFLPDPQAYAVEIGIRQLWPLPNSIPSATTIFTHAGVSRVGAVYWLEFGLPPEPAGGLLLHGWRSNFSHGGN